jgi:hypothetical protein
MTETLLFIARAMSTFLACATTSGRARWAGRPLFVGTNKAVAPLAAMMRAGSEKLESLQITIPNVTPLTAKTGT